MTALTQTARVNPGQTIAYVSADVSTFQGAAEALAKCPTTPDTVFCCAGGAKPGLFIEQTEADFEAAVRTDYFTALATAHVRPPADPGECQGNACEPCPGPHCACELGDGFYGPCWIFTVLADEVCHPR